MCRVFFNHTDWSVPLMFFFSFGWLYEKIEWCGVSYNALRSCDFFIFTLIMSRDVVFI